MHVDAPGLFWNQPGGQAEHGVGSASFAGSVATAWYVPATHGVLVGREGTSEA